MPLLLILKILNICCFMGYGLSSLLSQRMRTEFTRYGLSHYRRLTGWLQIAGSLGLLAGFYFEPLAHLSSFGLTLMMFFAVGVRIKIQDPFFETLPALFFLFLNLIIFLMSLQLVPEFQLSF